MPQKVIGISIDCSDENLLADFYVAMLGWTKTYSGGDSAVVSTPEAAFLLVCQRVDNYQPPIWPTEKNKQARMMHFDFYVENLDEAVAHAVTCGATKSGVQYYEDSTYMFDPAGHPFCLSTVWEDALFAK